MATPNIVPRADSEGGLGTASKYWASAYIDLIYVGAGKMGRDADNLIDFSTDNSILFRTNNADRLRLDLSQFYPVTDNGVSLGTATQRFSDLFLASGAVINFDNGNVALTHSSGALTLADNQKFNFGSGNDLQIKHSGSGGFITNVLGDLTISNTSDDGDIIFQSDDGSGGTETYLMLDGNANNIKVLRDMRFSDNEKAEFGAIGDLKIYHYGSGSMIENETGPLQIKQDANDEDIQFFADDGSGGMTEYFRVDGGAEVNLFLKNGRFNDNVKALFGSAGDLQIYHDGSNSYTDNQTGDLYIRNLADDKDIKFVSDNGAGSIATYFFLDGSSATHDGSATTSLYTNWPDNSYISLGTSHDLQIYHDGSNSYITQSGTGHLQIRQTQDDKDIKFECDDGAGGTATYFFLDGSLATHDGSATTGLFTNWPDNSQVTLGSSRDLKLYHNGTNSNIENFTGTLQIIQTVDDEDIVFRCDDGSGGHTPYITLDGDNQFIQFGRNTYHPDNKYITVGSGQDLQVYHNGTDSYIDNNTGNLLIRNKADDSDIIFESDNNSGGVVEYMRIDGGAARVVFSKDVKLQDNNILRFGSGNDLQIVHNGTDSTITNITGNFNFYQNNDDGHIRFYNDDGSGGTTEYVRLDGSDVSTAIKTIKVLMPNLPTSDPSVAGQLYIDASADRVLKVSAG